jgi:CxC2 like cysteine cluster associated with KDZ transposases
VVHTNGVHTLKIQLCACYGDRSHAKFQLLRCSWLPATTEDPQTAFTFDVLDSYLLLSLQGKVSREDYYLSISRLTDNTGLDPPKVRDLTLFRYSYADVTRSDM